MLLNAKEILFARKHMKAWVESHQDFKDAKKKYDDAVYARQVFRPKFDEDAVDFVRVNQMALDEIETDVQHAADDLERCRGQLEGSFRRATKAFGADADSVVQVAKLDE